MVAAREHANRFRRDVCGQDEEADGNQLLGASLRACRLQAGPVKSQTTTKPTALSIRLSIPKPISAIEEAAIPATSAIANSMKCQAIPPQARRRARRTMRRRSSPPARVAIPSRVAGTALP
jgi:hypothetical protein